MQERIVTTVIDEFSGGVYEDIIRESNSLQNILQNIQKEIQIIENLEFTGKKDKGTQRFLKHLDERYYSLYAQIKLKDTNIKNMIIQSITKLYFLTEQYFSELGLITKPQFQMTAIIDDMYIQANFETELLQSSTNFLSLGEGDRGKISLKFDTNKVVNRLRDSVQQDLESIEQAKKLYNHYTKFSTPFRRVNNKGGYINWGYVREAFERHLENLHRSFNGDINNFQECKMESVGQRWILYRYSSGSDPYFTGPDTESSQVKAENASLVGDIDTVLNTARFILLEASGQLKKDVGKEQIVEALKTQNLNEISTFSKKLWNYLSKTAQDTVENELGKVKGLKFT